MFVVLFELLKLSTPLGENASIVFCVIFADASIKNKSSNISASALAPNLGLKASPSLDEFASKEAFRTTSALAPSPFNEILGAIVVINSLVVLL